MGLYSVLSFIEPVMVTDFGITSMINTVKWTNSVFMSSVEFHADVMTIGIEEAEPGSFVLVAI